MTATTTITVASRARRALRALARFRFDADATSAPQFAQIGAHNYGSVIGVYENPPGVDPALVVITESALGCIGSEQARWIKFDDIATTQGPKEKLTDDTITVVLKSGIETTVRIAGGDDRFKDIFSFVRFIDRVVEDRRPGS
jgi:hypothetical protein